MTRAHLQRRRGQDSDSDIRGAAAEAIIAVLPDLVASYPYLAINLPGIGRIGRARRP